MGFFSSIGDAIGSIGGIAGSVVGGVLGGVGDYFNDKHNASKAYKQQRNDEINFWNMQNAYNDPSAQMARLKNAGLNPMMVYGSGNVTGNSSSSLSAPSMDASSYSSNRYGQTVDKLTRMNLQQQMINQTDAGSLENQLKQVQLEKARWELDNLKAGQNTNGVINQVSNSVKPFNVTKETTIDEIMSNPDLTTEQKARAVNLVNKLEPKPYGSVFNLSTWANILRDTVNMFGKTDWSKQRAREDLRRFRAEAMRR